MTYLCYTKENCNATLFYNVASKYSGLNLLMSKQCYEVILKLILFRNSMLTKNTRSKFCGIRPERN